jgi:hypothetical protein
MVKMDLILSQIDLTTAKTTNENVTAIYEATQAAGVVTQNPATAPVTDEILASAGFKDHNQAPIVPEPEVAATEPMLLPAPTQPDPALPAVPASPARGIMRGIQTPQLESPA